jgi:hypothetical protein
MATEYLHQRKDFPDLIRIVAEDERIDPSLVEKDYLETVEVQAFIGTEEYRAHKKRRFRQADNPSINENEAFLLSGGRVRATYEEAYDRSCALYYRDLPTLDSIMSTIQTHASRP